MCAVVLFKVIVCESSSSNQAAAVDQEMIALMKYVTGGWPGYVKSCEHVVVKYWGIRHGLGQCDGLLFYKSRLVVPQAMSWQRCILVIWG